MLECGKHKTHISRNSKCSNTRRCLSSNHMAACNTLMHLKWWWIPLSLLHYSEHQQALYNLKFDQLLRWKWRRNMPKREWEVIKKKHVCLQKKTKRWCVNQYSQLACFLLLNSSHRCLIYQAILLVVGCPNKFQCLRCSKCRKWCKCLRCSRCLNRNSSTTWTRISTCRTSRRVMPSSRKCFQAKSKSFKIRFNPRSSPNLQLVSGRRWIPSSPLWSPLRTSQLLTPTWPHKVWRRRTWRMWESLSSWSRFYRKSSVDRKANGVWW